MNNDLNIINKAEAFKLFLLMRKPILFSIIYIGLPSNEYVYSNLVCKQHKHPQASHNLLLHYLQYIYIINHH